jgi:hypothetical protein
MKRIALGLLLLSAVAMSGCSLFKERCHCPKFGYQHAPQQHQDFAQKG